MQSRMSPELFLIDDFSVAGFTCLVSCMSDRAGGEFSDRVLRLNPKSGEIVEYLLPKFTNIRRVFVDNSTTPPTFWVGNNHGASIVKLEPLE